MRSSALVLETTPPRIVKLKKSVTSIGKAMSCDVHIDDESLENVHAHILRDGEGFRVFAADGARVLINGKRKAESTLGDGDELSLGKLLIRFQAEGPITDDVTDPVISSPHVVTDASDTVPLEAYKKLYRFTSTLNDSPNVKVMKNRLVDAVIDLVEADTGFLLILRDDEPQIDIARSGTGEDLPADGQQLSASIVKQVVERRRPVLLSDALEDSIFSASYSVVNLKLRSVIAVPILLGDEILGVLYLGCNRKTSAFSPGFLDIVGVFASQAGLLVKNAMFVESLREDNQALKEQLDRQTFGEIVGGSDSMKGIFRAISRFAPTDISVLVMGETGTGKELIAREIHRNSTRAEGPFVAINMSAIPENLLEAELFGHVKGAFTGALTNRRGKFAEANGGTLFLDEIGDMPHPLQSKLLRVLQERAVNPVGSNDSVPIDIRVISATNRNLDEMQQAGTFRPDLYFRINEVHVNIPPLRERGEDVVLLATYFLSKYAQQMKRRIRKFTPRATAAMKRFTWRGNVRELEARVKKAVVMAEGPDIDLIDLDLEPGGMSQVMTLRDAKEAYARRYIEEVLALNDGNRSQTARDLGIDPRTVYKYLEGR